MLFYHNSNSGEISMSHIIATLIGGILALIITEYIIIPIISFFQSIKEKYR